MRRAPALLATAALLSCQPTPPRSTENPPGSASGGVAVGPTSTTAALTEPGPDGRKPEVPPVKAEAAPAPSPRREAPPLKELGERAESYFAGEPNKRIHIQVDKPLYQPGETIWVKTWHLAARNLALSSTGQGMRYQLVSPKGATVIDKMVREEHGLSTGELDLPADVQGGEYIIRMFGNDGTTAERPVIVNAYEAPRIKKKLEFVRKAYGAGDEVTATVDMKRPTGEPLANQALTAIIRLDGAELPRVALKTGPTGEGLVRFNLPSSIELGDGLLTVLVEDGGVTESVSKSIPIILKKLQFSFFPEGGKLVTGLESRLYFEAKNTIGKPADVEGRIVDDVGNAVATFRTHKMGLGRVTFTPGTGRSYKAQITKPAGVTESYPLPLAEENGCVLRTFDDLDGELSAIRARVTCTEKRPVIVAAVLRDNVLDAAAVDASSDGAIVHLEPKDAALARAQGAARITVFDDKLTPLAERIVYRNRRHGLRVKVEAHKPTYAPRDQVTLSVTTLDHTGAPRPAELAMSVVDDTVISFADDKTGHMLSRLFLEPEVPGKVEEPNTYFDLSDEKSALAMELLMGTRGWRSFDWQPVLRPVPAAPSTGIGMLGGGGMPAEAAFEGALERPMMPKGGARARANVVEKVAMAPPPQAAPPPPAPPPAPVMQPMADAKPVEAKMKNEVAKEIAAGPARRQARDEAVGAIMAQRIAREADDDGDADKDWAGKKQAVAWAVARVFPAPSYNGDYAGPRTDFRETIHWQPTIHTGKDGKATVTFFLSDAITSFRVFTEGIGGGLAGRDETVIQSKLPFSMNVKLPVEVSAGDRILMPLTLTNERDKPISVELDATFGPLLTLQKSPLDGQPQLAANGRQSVFYPLDVTGMSGKSPVAFHAAAGGLKDDFTRELSVTARGFPQVLAQSGRVDGTTSFEVELGDIVPGTAEASIRLFASPVATMMSGLDGMLREPCGCFEQTSSTNYPNVMIMQYLRESETADTALVEKSNKLLDTGYKRLTGYESPNKGYEWFGGDPGHEALTAYGLLEFADMKGVYPDVDDAMIARTSTWLKSRRDGQGGYKRDPKALDSFGQASPEVTNAYITWALSEAKTSGIDTELDAQAKLAESTQDAYLMALATGTLLNVPSRKSEGLAAAKKLAGMQTKEGAWTNASHSITRSGGVNLHIESTALAVLALLKTGSFRGEIDRAIGWLQQNRGGFGQWGATQSTVLALKAMTEYARSNRRTQSSGVVTVSVNGQPAISQSYDAGRREPILFAELGKHFKAGKNVVTITHKGGEALPYTAAIEYRSIKPATSAQATIGLTTSLEKPSIKMGENVRLNVVVTNKTQEGRPMTLARVGFPGGLAAQTWQLKELKDKGLIGFFETRPREVILYFRDMKPGEVKNVPIDLVATIPGEFTAPASSAYLYYNDEHRTWTDPLSISITP